MAAVGQAVSASGQGGLLVRVDPSRTDQLLRDPQARPFVMRGRELAGWLRVDLDASADDADVRRWVDEGVTYARSLPAK